jgi:hypothetical protein
VSIGFPARASVPGIAPEMLTLPDTGDHVAVRPAPSRPGPSATPRRILAASNEPLLPADLSCTAADYYDAGLTVDCDIEPAVDLVDGVASYWGIELSVDEESETGLTGDTIKIDIDAPMPSSQSVFVDNTPPLVAHHWAGRELVVPRSNTVVWSSGDADAGLGTVGPQYLTQQRWVRSRSWVDGPRGVLPAASGEAELTLDAYDGFTTYCVVVVAYDRVRYFGISGLSDTTPYGTVCTVVAGDDVQLMPARGFVRATGADYAFGTVSYAQRAGATLTVPRAVAQRVVVKARSCPTCGGYEVLLGLHRLGKVDLAGPKGFRTTHLAAPREVTGDLVIRSTSARWTGIDLVWATGPCVSATGCFADLSGVADPPDPPA